MASSHAYRISNPKENNRDLAVLHYTAGGARKMLALLRPGQGVEVDRPMVFIEERMRAVTLVTAPDGGYTVDTSRKALPGKRNTPVA